MNQGLNSNKPILNVLLLVYVFTVIINEKLGDLPYVAKMKAAILYGIIWVNPIVYFVMSPHHFSIPLPGSLFTTISIIWTIVGLLFFGMSISPHEKDAKNRFNNSTPLMKMFYRIVVVLVAGASLLSPVIAKVLFTF